MKSSEYTEATEFLFTQLPMFQRTGASAYKPGLDTARELAAAFGNPHDGLRCIHVAGTNGKGSTSHTIAAVLQSAGYKVGLYTSPHLIDFRERIRVNGDMIPEADVVDFTRRYRNMRLDSSPSFFELTTIMAFEYFRRSGVDVAVIETGLGGRLDTTNIIHPDLCVITNISLDHTALLGDTLQQIAVEKAGIIKPGVPVAIGEASGAVRKVFNDTARKAGAPIVFACDDTAIHPERNEQGLWTFAPTLWGTVEYGLCGECQKYNGLTVLTALGVMDACGFDFTDADVRRGMADVASLTGLVGRWTCFGRNPVRICDTGHNIGGWQYLAPQIDALPGCKHMVIGFVSDKDVSAILKLISERVHDKHVYFTRASVDRALSAETLAEKAAEAGLYGVVCQDVVSAYKKALAEASESDSVFVGGSTFVVADLMAYISAQQ
ncbi:MAG: bifunctional folylpolyglutamate synthase/dihydrofolate synthase [Muribaculaceae bacterium]|nr:bifunctional folylpolyglutamate synthase/dihydrofolate synthase [Muribaculaceae bacterium]